jgi:hypothetical protein
MWITNIFSDVLDSSDTYIQGVAIIAGSSILISLGLMFGAGKVALNSFSKLKRTQQNHNK